MHQVAGTSHTHQQQPWLPVWTYRRPARLLRSPDYWTFRRPARLLRGPDYWTSLRPALLLWNTTNSSRRKRPASSNLRLTAENGRGGVVECV